MRTALLIAGKDLRQQLGNGTVLLFGIVLPLGLAFLFSTILADPVDGFQASYVVADEDGGPAAQALVDDTLGAVAANTSFEFTPVESADAARQRVDDGAADAAFVVPEGFSADLEAGRTATLEVIGSADAQIAAYIAREIAQAYATDVRGIQLAVAVTAAGTPVPDPAALAEQAQATPPPLALATGTVANRELDTQTHYAAGMAVFFLFFVAMLSVSSILEERSGKTMARLLAAPVSRPAILAGKLLGGVGIGLAAMAILIAGTTLLMGASWGPPVGVALLVMAVVLAATGLMSVIATLARTTEQAANWMSGLAVVLGMFGGSFIPLAQLGALARLSYATPHRWFLQGLSDLSGGAGLDVVVAPVAGLLAFAAGSFVITGLRIGKVIKP